MYYWVAHSTDESVRNSTLEKMEWNTEFDEGESIHYIRYNPYSGEYIYKIKERREVK